MTAVAYWIWLSALRELRPHIRLRLVERFGGAKGIYSAGQHVFASLPFLLPAERMALARRDEGHAMGTVERCEALGIQILTWQDSAFPSHLRNIPDPPVVLYVKGHLPKLEAVPVLAVVGTRQATDYGKRMAEKLAGELAKQNAVVVSGLAAGIDSFAAQGALSAGGKVVGVLGVAINQVYPKSNAALYDQVAAAGALISEYAPDERGGAYRFRARNRILAGLSHGVVVVQAPERSGALITAAFANEYGRDVFAVPGNSDVPESRGGNLLLRDFAILAESGQDILEEYQGMFARTLPNVRFQAAPSREADAPEVPEAEVRGRPEAQETLSEQLGKLSEAQLRIVSAMDAPGMHVDDIIAAVGLPASVVLSELTLLQIKGFVLQEPGKRFSLNIRR